MTWSSPRCPHQYHYLVHRKQFYFVGIGPICEVELTRIFGHVLLFVRCIEDRSQYYNIFLNIHMFLNVVIMILEYFLYPILVQKSEKCSF